MDYVQARALNGAIRTIGMRHRALAGAVLRGVGLAVGQEALIMELGERGPRTQAQLAAAAGCEPPTITSAVRRLEALGLVARRPSTQDRRAMVVELTERGRELLDDLAAAWVQLAEASVAGLSRTRTEDLYEALGDLADSLRAAHGATEPPPRPKTPDAARSRGS